MSLKFTFLFIIAFYIFLPLQTSIKQDLVLDRSGFSLHGTLLLTDTFKTPVALIISGSGPTDRNGNQPKLINNSLKMLAELLQTQGIASLRYDKRGIGQSRIKNLNESELRFEDFVGDASAWLKLLQEDERFNKIIVIGHSEGSLIGILAAQSSSIDQFISLAGPGRSADMLLKEQLSRQKLVSYFANPLINDLVEGKQVKAPFFLKTLFRPSVQPYLISWFKYNPEIEITKLKADSLIIQGTNDLQVSVEDARILANSSDRAELRIVVGMNHILKNTSQYEKENISSYNQPEMPINKELISEIVKFINQ